MYTIKKKERKISLNQHQWNKLEYIFKDYFDDVLYKLELMRILWNFFHINKSSGVYVGGFNTNINIE